jgi:hypothetical protein
MPKSKKKREVCCLQFIHVRPATTVWTLADSRPPPPTDNSNNNNILGTDFYRHPFLHFFFSFFFIQLIYSGSCFSYFIFGVSNGGPQGESKVAGPVRPRTKKVWPDDGTNRKLK